MDILAGTYKRKTVSACRVITFYKGRASGTFAILNNIILFPCVFLIAQFLNAKIIKLGYLHS